jgi:hypothetical protein
MYAGIGDIFALLVQTGRVQIYISDMFALLVATDRQSSVMHRILNSIIVEDACVLGCNAV